jgi:hypothetical protein
MTANQYKAAIDRLGLTQVGAARFLGVDERTSRRWIADERPVPEPVARFLRFMIAAKVTPEEVEKALSRYR